MSATLHVNATSLLSLTWELPKNMVTGKGYGTTEYSARDLFVYKRVPVATSVDGRDQAFDFFRAPYRDAMRYRIWTDIPRTAWEPVDIYGMPQRRTG